MAPLFAFGYSSCGRKPECPEGNPPVWLGDHLTCWRRVSNLGRSGESVNTAPASDAMCVYGSFIVTLIKFSVRYLWPGHPNTYDLVTGILMFLYIWGCCICYTSNLDTSFSPDWKRGVGLQELDRYYPFSRGRLPEEYGFTDILQVSASSCEIQCGNGEYLSKSR